MSPENYVMNYEDMTDLLLPGYLPVETGYRMLPNGELFVAVHNRLLGCRAKWLDLWFGHFETEADFQEWHPDEHFNHHWNDKWRKGHYIGAAHTARQSIGGRHAQFSTLHFEDPARMFSKEAQERAGATIVLAYGTPGNYGDSQEKMTRFVHVARDTKLGCEIRSRFWVKTSIDFGPSLIDHVLGEFGHASAIWQREFGQPGSPTA
jgi:hypothetical protein